jgi:3'(2'), 5'-bisphosphate nucleotidase
MESDNKMKELRRIAFKAGEILLEYRNNIDLKIKEKKDKFDLVSEADFAADRYIKKELTKLFPDDAILTEESGLVGNAESNRVWMIDPLDGTYNYLNGGESFAVHIGLAVNLEPILGIVYAPVRNNMYFAESGKGSFLDSGNGEIEQIHVSNVSIYDEAVMVGRNGIVRDVEKEKFMSGFVGLRRINESGTGLKMCAVAEGRADMTTILTVGFGKWDVCAPQIIIEEAGGRVSQGDGAQFDYSINSNHLEGVMVTTNKLLHDRLLESIKELI